MSGVSGVTVITFWYVPTPGRETDGRGWGWWWYKVLGESRKARPGPTQTAGKKEYEGEDEVV